jgi:hypothetical protein
MKLAQDLSAVAGRAYLDEVVEDPGYRASLRVDGELMPVVAGFGTTILRVNRGDSATTHASGDDADLVYRSAGLLASLDAPAGEAMPAGSVVIWPSGDIPSGWETTTAPANLVWDGDPPTFIRKT